MVRRLRVIALCALSLLTLLSITAFRLQDDPVDSPEAAGGERMGRSEGAAFAMSNVTADNRIVRYRRAADGRLTRVGSISTRGTGIGTDLDTQSGLELSADRRFLYAVNAGSDDVTVFAVDGTQLTFLQKVYAGDVPNSITIHRDLLYVLNGSVAGNGIRGYKVGNDGRLRPLENSVRLLSSPIAVPGEVQFSPDGRHLLVTHKTQNVLLDPVDAIDVFSVDRDGLPSEEPRRNESEGLRPFSLAFRNDGRLVVVESFNAAPEATAVSSYRLSSEGRLKDIDDSVPNGQTDGCWIVVSKRGNFAFVANFGSGTISSYRFDSDGDLRLIEGRAAFLGDMSQPVDLAMSDDGRYLYLLLRGTGAVASFRVDRGELESLGLTTGGLPVADGASGLAVH